MPTEHVTLKFGADASEVTATTNEVKRDLTSLGQVAQQTGTQLSASLGQAATSGAEMLSQMSGTTKRLATQIYDATQAIGAGVKNASLNYEALFLGKAAKWKVAASDIEPFLAQLRRVQQETIGAAQANRQLDQATQFLKGLQFQVGNLGKSNAELLQMQATMLGVGKQAAPLIQQLTTAQKSMAGLGRSSMDTAMAMRFVAPQVTDIVTALASGQQPFTVLIQQGGQLKDLFGGVVPALKAMVTYVASMINPFTVAAAAVGALAFAYAKGAQEQDQFVKALILTNGAIGLSSDKLQDISRSLSNFGTTQGRASEAVSALAGSTKIASQNLEDFARVALKLERQVGTPIEETRKQLEELAKSPSEAIVRLTEQYGFLTAETYKHIRALEDQGRVADAAALAQKTYAEGMERIADRLADRLGYLARAWNWVKDAAKGAWDAMLNIGREQTLDQRIGTALAAVESAKQRIADLQTGALPNSAALNASALETARERLRIANELLSNLQRQALLVDKVAQEERDRVSTNQSQIAWEQLRQQYLQKEVQYKREIAQAEEKYRASGVNDPAQLAAVIAGINEKYKSMFSEQKRALEQQASLIAKLSGLSASFYKDWDGITKQFKEGKITLDDMIKLQADLLDQQPFAKEMAKELEKTGEAIAKLQAKSDEALRKEVEALEAANKKAKEKLAIGTLTIDQANELIRKQHEHNILMQQANILALQNADARTEVIALEERKLAAMKDAYQRVIEEQEVERKKTIAKYIGDSTATERKEWQKTADSINDALVNSFMRSAEAGKSIFQSLRDAIEGMFRADFFKPLLNNVFRPLSQGLASSFYGVLGGGNSGGATNYNFGSAANPLSSLWNAWSGGTTGLFNSFAYSNIGTSLGLSYNPLGEAGGTVLSELGLSIGEWVPYIGVAIAAYSVYKALRSPGGPKGGGQSFLDFTATGVQVSPLQTASATDGGRLLYTPDTADLQIAELTSGLYDSMDSVFKTFGADLQGITVGLGYDTDPQGTASSRVASQLLLDGQQIYSVQRDVGRDEGAVQQGLTEEIIRLTVAGLQSADLPGKIGRIFDSVDIDTASIEELNKAISDATDWKNLTSAMRLLGLEADNLTDSAVKAAGGTQALTAVVAAYYDATRTEAEKLADKTSLLNEQFTALGVTMPDNVYALRALVEALQGVPSGTEDFTSYIDGLLSDAQGFADKFGIPVETVVGALEQASTILDTLGDNAPNLQALIVELMGLAPALESIVPAAAVLEQATVGATQALLSFAEAMSAFQNSAMGVGSLLSDPLQRFNYEASIWADKFAAIGMDLPKDLNALGEYILELQNTPDMSPTQLASLTALQDLATSYASWLSSWTNNALPDAVDGNTDAINKELDAINKNIEMLQEQAGLLRRQISAIESFIDASLKLRQSLLVGPYSPLSPQDQYNAALLNFQTLAQLASTGDEFAMQNLPQAASSLLDASRVMFASSEEYAKDFQMVLDTIDSVNSVAEALASSKSSQLDAIEKALEVNEGLAAAARDLPNIAGGVAGIGLTLEEILFALGNIELPGYSDVTSPSDPVVKMVADWYKTIAKKVPDAEGLAYWVSEYKTGGYDVKKAFIDSVNSVYSSEYAAIGKKYEPIPTEVLPEADTEPDYESIVKSWYSAIGTEADTEGVEYWVNDAINFGIAHAKTAFKNAAEAILGELPEFAIGGTPKRGWALVGERGPELVRFPGAGEIVMDARESRAMMSRSSKEQDERSFVAQERQNELLSSIDRSLKRLEQRTALIEAR